MKPGISNQETDKFSNLVNLFPVDESENFGITNPYMPKPIETANETTERLIQLINRGKV